MDENNSLRDMTASTAAELMHTSLVQRAGIAAIMIGVAIFLFIYALYAPKRKVDIQDPSSIMMPDAKEYSPAVTYGGFNEGTQT